MFGKKKEKPQDVVIDMVEPGAEPAPKKGVKAKLEKYSFKNLPLKKKILTVLIAILAFYVISSLVFSPIMYNILFKRSEMPAYTTELSYDMIDKAQYTRTPDSFQSGKNVLNGVVYEAKNKKGTVIVVNGQNAGIDTHLAEIMYFVDHGYNVFTYDGTGVRTSGGKSQRGLSQPAIDCKNAVKFIQASSFKDENLVIYAHSLGGLAAAASLQRKGEVDACVLIASLESPIGTMFSTAKKYAGPVVYPEYPFLCLQDFFTFGVNTNKSAVSGINRSKIPVLIVQGAHDETLLPGTSLYEAKDRIKNDQVEYLYIEDEYRGMHSAAWLSEDAAVLKASEEEMLAALKKANKKGIPEDQYERFINTIDFDKMYELDEAFMSNILDFYEDACADQGK